MNVQKIRPTALILAAASCLILVGGWIGMYPKESDPKNLHYVLWKRGLYPLDPNVALDTMVGDADQSKLVIGKSKNELAAKFGFLTPIQSASQYDQIAYQGLPIDRSKHEVFVLRNSTWLVILTNGVASDLILVKGN